MSESDHTFSIRTKLEDSMMLLLLDNEHLRESLKKVEHALNDIDTRRVKERETASEQIERVIAHLINEKLDQYMTVQEKFTQALEENAFQMKKSGKCPIIT